MGDRTNIEWADATWNPVTGCSPIASGCANCYAARDAQRMGSHPNAAVRARYEGLTEIPEGSSKPRFNGVARAHWDLLEIPLRWQKPRRIFVCSQADLFHGDVPDDFIHWLFETVGYAPRHRFLFLTKRPNRMRDLLDRGVIRALPNAWFGVSASIQRDIDLFATTLRDLGSLTDGRLFLSLEPLLGPIDLSAAPPSWVIAGGESGPGARPCYAPWVESLRDQCAARDIPFFFKQWGESIPRGQWPGPPDELGAEFARLGKKACGRLLDGREHLEFPEGLRL